MKINFSLRKTTSASSNKETRVLYSSPKIQLHFKSKVSMQYFTQFGFLIENSCEKIWLLVCSNMTDWTASFVYTEQDNENLIAAASKCPGERFSFIY